MTASGPQQPIHERVQAVLREYWGYGSLRPLQAEAIQAGLERRDSLVVLPTGGGKSLCYQIPPLVAERTDVVVSPLISLMKDQVDGLRACKYPTAALHSAIPADRQRRIEEAFLQGRYRLLLVSPERLMTPRFLEMAERVPVSSFAIDEAHCISHWGHDFRPEYRQLAVLKERFPQASVHAYTATATERVRDDIVHQLNLHNPHIVVGIFDRANLTYRVTPRSDTTAQVREVLERHSGEAAIVYCITRRETEELALALQAAGFAAACYHAGLPAEERRDTQDRFAREELDVVVATVAFGMGIDRSNVRCVIHTALPKSIEHYQQETGRAGRDWLAAECVLLWSPADAMRWQRIMDRPPRDDPDDNRTPAEIEQSTAAAKELLAEMRHYASGRTCRHKSLSEYFGQEYPRDNCEACDLCLGEHARADADVDSPDSDLARRVLAGVQELGQHFGLVHVVEVLTGANTKRIRNFHHDGLDCFATVRDVESKTLTGLIFQLIEQGVLDRTETDRPLLKLNAGSRAVLARERGVELIRPRSQVLKTVRRAVADWDGVDRDLFAELKDLRRDLAGARGVPAYVIFGDATLRDLARRKPTNDAEMLAVHGVGPRKLSEFGVPFLERIRTFTAADGD